MLAYNFYTINQQESGDIIDLKRRLKVLESGHNKDDDSKVSRPTDFSDLTGGMVRRGRAVDVCLGGEA